MAHRVGHTLPRTYPDGAVPPVRPRLPGQGGAMSFMDTVADLVRRFRYLHDPARPEWQTAAMCWPGLATTCRTRSRPPRPRWPERHPQAGFQGYRLADGLADWVAAGSPEQPLASWRSWPPSDQHEVLAQGLAEYARVMPTDDYQLAYHSGDAYQARLLVTIGWVPSLLGAMVAGAITAGLADELWLFPIVAFAGLVLGFLATLGSWSAASTSTCAGISSVGTGGGPSCSSPWSSGQ